jgi:hypothetical protein
VLDHLNNRELRFTSKMCLVLKLALSEFSKYAPLPDEYLRCPSVLKAKSENVNSRELLHAYRPCFIQVSWLELVTEVAVPVLLEQ